MKHVPGKDGGRKKVENTHTHRVDRKKECLEITFSFSISINHLTKYRKNDLELF